MQSSLPCMNTLSSACGENILTRSCLRCAIGTGVLVEGSVLERAGEQAEVRRGSVTGHRQALAGPGTAHCT